MFRLIKRGQTLSLRNEFNGKQKWEKKKDASINKMR